MPVGRAVIWKKRLVENAWQLDMASLAKRTSFEKPGSGKIEWETSYGERAVVGINTSPPHSLSLFYKVTTRDGNRTDYSYSIDIESTPCYFGGQRWWFHCPSCRRRCRILYLPYSEKIFACRKCHNLTYRSQQEQRNLFSDLMDAMLLAPFWEYKLKRTKSERTRRADGEETEPLPFESADD